MGRRKFDIFTGTVVWGFIVLVFVLMGVFPLWTVGQTTQPILPLPTTQPIITTPAYDFSPVNKVYANYSITCNRPWGSQIAGIGANNSTNCEVYNCRIEGYNFPIDFSGTNKNLHVHYCVILNATPSINPQTGMPYANGSGVYIEGADGDEWDHLVILFCGYWPGYDPYNPAHRSQASQYHGIYRNQQNSTTNCKIHDCIILYCAGSQIGCRVGGSVVTNVVGDGFDRSIILGGNGHPGQAQWGEIVGNLDVGPWTDAVPNYGGGFNLLCPGLLAPGSNMASNDAQITNNSLAVDMNGNVIQQIGYWSQAGGTKHPAKNAPCLGDYYGTSTYDMWGNRISQGNFFPLIKCDDAPKIAARFASLLVPPPPTVLGNGQTTTGQPFQVIAK